MPSAAKRFYSTKKISSTTNKVVVYVDNKNMHILNKKSTSKNDKNEKLNGMKL